MKAKTTLFLVLLAVAGIAILLLRHRNQQPTSGSLDSESAGSNTSAVQSVATGDQPQRVSSSFGPEVTNSPTLPSTNQPENVADTYASQLHQPIAFFGRVVDQNNGAIVGANVKLIWTHFTNPETSYETNLTTDINGAFSFQGVVGATLSVHVSKEGYIPMGDASNKTFSYSKTAFQRPFQPDAGSPIVFQLRKKASGSPLITSGSGMLPEFSVSIPRDGTLVKVDLLQQQISETGALQISQKKPEFKDWKKADQWIVRMTIPDGGFIEKTDELSFEAPESNYQETMEFDFQKTNSDWTINLKKDYFIKFGNPPLFGHLRIVTAIDIDDVRLIYEINPDGGRNLEPR